MKKIQEHPELFHGLLAGLVLMLVKLVLLFTGNWFFRVDSTYSFLSFVVILIAVVLAGNAEKKRRDRFPYFRAFGSAIITISIAVFLSLVADQIAYRSKPHLAEEVKIHNLEQLNKGLPAMTFVPAATREMIMEEMEKTDPKEMYTMGAFVYSLFSFVFLNGLWALIVAAFTKKSPKTGLEGLENEL